MRKLALFLTLAAAAFAQQPVVRSYAYTTLFSGVAATGTQTSAAVRLGNFAAYGTLAITGSSISGSPSGCQVALELETSAGAPASSAIATQTFTPGNSYQSFTITPGIGYNAGGQMVAVYTCSAYPAGGTLTVEYYTIDVAALLYPLPAGTNTIGAVNQAGAPWSVSQSGTWTMQPGNSANTTPWLVTIQQGGNAAAVTAANAVKVDGSAVTQPISAASLPLPTGAAQDTTVSGLEVAQGSTTSGQKGPLVQGAVTTSAPSDTNGQTAPISLTTAGAVRVDPSGVTAPVNVQNFPATQAVNVSQVGGNSVATAAAGVQKVGVVGNAGAALDAAPGSAAPTNAMQTCGTDGTNCVVPYIDPCQRGPKSWVNINQTAGTQLITGSASKKTYICGFWIAPVATATNIALVEGTGSVCGTSTISVSGQAGGGSGTAATGPNLVANEGYTVGSGGFAVAQATVAADNVCLLQSAANQISGGLSYVQY